jgi:hypothetical protein
MKARDQISTNVFGDLIISDLAELQKQVEETEYYNTNYNRPTVPAQVMPPGRLHL